MARYKTPLRYPGGKQKLAPFVLEVMGANDLIGGHYAEPYAGGAGVAMELLLADKVSHVHLNDSSRPIHAFWKSILEETSAFCRLIRTTPLTIKEWRRQREVLTRHTEFEDLEVGFSLFFLNRCNRSGIPSAGPIGGYKQDGEWKMDARYPKSELIARIEAIAARKSAITIHNLDAEKFITDEVPGLPKKSLVYLDPPYFHKSSRLYLNHYQPLDHKRLAGIIQKRLRRPWMVSYDGVPEIMDFYEKRELFLYELQYNAAKVYKGCEVFVFSDNLNVPKASCLPAIQQALRQRGGKTASRA